MTGNIVFWTHCLLLGLQMHVFKRCRCCAEVLPVVACLELIDGTASIKLAECSLKVCAVTLVVDL